MYIPNNLIIKEIDKNEYLLINNISGNIDIANKQVACIFKELNSDKLDEIDDKTLMALKDRNYVFNTKENYESFYNNLYNEVTSKIENQGHYIFNIVNSNENTIIPIELVSRVLKFSEKVINQKEYGNYEKCIYRVTYKNFILDKDISSLKYLIEGLKEKEEKLEIIYNDTIDDNALIFLGDNYQHITSIQIILNALAFINSNDNQNKILTTIDDLLMRNLKVILKLSFDTNSINRIEEVDDLIRKMDWKNNTNFLVELGLSNNIGLDIKLKETEFLEKVEKIFFRDKSAKTTYRVNDIKLLAHIHRSIKGQQSPFISYPLFSFSEATDGRQFIFTPNGEIYTSENTIGIKELSIGKLDNSLEIDLEKYSLWKNRKTIHMPKCRNCEIQLFCGGGEPLNSYLLHKNIYEPVCNDRKLVINEYIENLINRGRI